MFERLYDMAMGTRKKRERQQDLWIATSAVVQPPGHAFYGRLNEILDEHHFDQNVVSRTGPLYWVETHKAVFRWVLRILAGEDLLPGRTIAINATTLEANAAMKSIVRREDGQTYRNGIRVS